MAKKYKKLAKCKICKERYVVDKKSDVYGSKYEAKYYCKDCYNKYNKGKSEETDSEES